MSADVLLVTSHSISSSSSTNSSGSVLMEDILAILEGKKEDPAALLRRMNSLLGLNDAEIISTRPTKQTNRAPYDVTAVPKLTTPSSSVSSSDSSSNIKCGWFICWTVDGAE